MDTDHDQHSQLVQNYQEYNSNELTRGLVVSDQIRHSIQESLPGKILQKHSEEKLEYRMPLQELS